MSVRVRLQGLPPLADSFHIRSFFTGLKIPSGGVTIIGGVDGEAYVIFESFIGALHAINRSGETLLNSRIHVSLSEEEQTHKKDHHGSVCKPGYVRISFHPFDATFFDVKSLLKDLSVKSVIFLTKNKARNGQALVKFSKRRHACKALLMNNADEGTSKPRKHKKRFSVLSVTKSNEAEWIKFGGKVESKVKGSTGTPGFRSQKHHEEFNTWYNHELYAHLTNVSRRAKKRHIKRFLYNLVGDSQITFVYDKNGCRTQDCFVKFVTDNDYVKALGLDKSTLKGRLVRVLPVSKAQVTEFIESRKLGNAEDPVVQEDVISEESLPTPSNSGSKLTCIYLRNFAADVNKHDILNFFTGFAVKEEDIYMLSGDNGDGLGEVLVKFSSEEEASIAKTLNHKVFQGTEILLKCIPEGEMKAFGVDKIGSSFDSSDVSTGKEECQLDDLQVCVSVEDDSPDVTCDSS